jgi:hypothetical protein
MLDTITPHAFDSRLAQLTGKGFVEYEFDAWTAFFDVQHEQLISDEWMRWHDPVESVRFMGAWRDYDGLFCGNAAEVAAIVGAKEVARWEAYVWSREDGE